MSNPAEIVNRFLAAWEPAQGYQSAIREWFTADCVYENVGLTRTTGPEEAIAVLQAMGAQMGFTSLKVKTLAEAVNGPNVLNERIDDLYDADGKLLVSLHLMGVFETRDGKISAWRDYFDPSPFKGG